MAVVLLISLKACGVSSTIFTLIVPLAVLPSVSVATTAKFSLRVVPLPVLWDSLSSNV
ncbi:hypothetical protein D3C72_1947810 [compost metagenome]